jgi:hypothetical protein
MRSENFAVLSPYGATLRCSICTIFIGDRHAETIAFPSPDGIGVVCSACAATLERATALMAVAGRCATGRPIFLRPEDRPGHRKT